MSQPLFHLPTDRALIAVSGEDRATFLQGIITNDIGKVAPGRAIWAAFLTPQGKYLHDFFISQIGETFYFDTEAGERRADLHKRVARYKLRYKAAVEIEDGLIPVLAYGEGALEALGLPAEPGAAVAFQDGVAYTDPRLPEAGARLVLPAETAAATMAAAGFAEGSAEAYDAMRLSLGLPDGSRDLEVERSTLLENGFEELNGVDFKKGCYMGQEVTARTHYRGLVKKRLLPVDLEGATPAPGTPVKAGDKEAGTMRSAMNGLGLALLKTDYLDADAALEAGGAKVVPHKPDWMKLSG